MTEKTRETRYIGLRKRYCYDEHLLDYVPVSGIGIHKSGYFNWKRLLVLVVTPLAFTYGAFHADYHYTTEQHVELRTGAEKFLRQLTKLEKDLDDIHRNDEVYYRSIMNLPIVEPEIWEGGTGGGDKPIVTLAEDPLEHFRRRILRLKYRADLQSQSLADLQGAAVAKSGELSKIPVLKPIIGRIVSGFGPRGWPGGAHFHQGLDIVAAIGTPIRAACDGVVVTAGSPEWGYGLQIEVRHGVYQTKYAHLSRMAVVEGQQVKRGEVIGYTGNSGYSTGPHLHYEVMKHGVKIDPYPYCLVGRDR